MSVRLSQALVLIGGFSIHLYNGCMYLWGNIAPYVISYFYHFGGKDGAGEPDLTIYDAVYVIPFLTIVLAFMNPAGAFLFNCCNPKVLIGIGSMIGVLAMCLSTIAATFSQFVLCFAVIYGFGIGFCYFTPLACGWQWVPDHRGFVTGFILSAFGFGVFVFSFISQAVVNPENEQAEALPDGTRIYAKHIAERVSFNY